MTLAEGCQLAADSFPAKREQIGRYSRWSGNPAMPERATGGGSMSLGGKGAGQSRDQPVALVYGDHITGPGGRRRRRRVPPAAPRPIGDPRLRPTRGPLPGHLHGRLPGRTRIPRDVPRPGRRVLLLARSIGPHSGAGPGHGDQARRQRRMNFQDARSWCRSARPRRDRAVPVLEWADRRPRRAVTAGRGPLCCPRGRSSLWCCPWSCSWRGQADPTPADSEPAGQRPG